jgi:phosphatidylinositol alpha-1,6-mannosyltransferase
VVILTCEYSPFPGGIATYVQQVANTLRETGHRTLVLAPDYPGADAAEPDVERPFGHHRIGLKGALAALRSLSKAPRDAIVMACDIRTVMLAYAARILTGRRYRAIIHGSEVSKFVRPSPLKPLVQAAYRAADLVSANSAATREAFVASFGERKRLVVNHLGVDPSWFEPVKGGFDNPELAAIPEAAPLVVTVGRIEDRKGQAFAVAVVDAARRRSGLPFVYVAAGVVVDPAYAAEAKAKAAELETPTVFPGRLSDADVARLYRRAVCHLLCAQSSPTKIEGFGLVLVEAAAQGCPSVAAAVGGIPEVLSQVAGRGFDQEDKDGMAAEIVRLASGGGERDRRSAAARAGAATFTWRRCTAGIFPELDL